MYPSKLIVCCSRGLQCVPLQNYVVFAFFYSYLVMPFMGTDLSKIMKHEKLSEDRIQFLVYQMLKGLKVRVTCMYMFIYNCQPANIRKSTVQWNHWAYKGVSLHVIYKKNTRFSILLNICIKLLVRIAWEFGVKYCCYMAIWVIWVKQWIFWTIS